jgi:GNAT superfamily N-acetyltransferase
MTTSSFGPYEIDDDPGRVDIDLVHQYLSEESYWAVGHSRDVVVASFEASARVVGAYLDGEQVGYCRVVTDGVAVAYLADVFIIPDHQGKGLGRALVQAAVDDGPYAELRWVLHTRDAHDLYRALGFGAPSDWMMERPKPA